MKEEVKNVRTGGNLVGTVPVPVYETITELTEKEDGSRILAMFNKQNAVRIMGNERAKHTLARVGKGKRFEIGFNLLPNVVSNEEMNAAIGDITKLKALIASSEMQTAIDDWLEEQKSTPAE